MYVDWSLRNRGNDGTLLASAMVEMAELATRGVDCWVFRIDKIKELLNIKPFHRAVKSKVVGTKIHKIVKGNFDRFFLDSINKVVKNNCTCPRDHNKLRFYKKFKGSFTCEPYIEMVNNRNQRQFLSLFRVSSHRLRVETGCWTFPKTVYEDRICLYCNTEAVDTELHCIIDCALTENNRNRFFNILCGLNPSFLDLSNESKLAKILCPCDPVCAKLSNKYLELIVKTRDLFDKGKPVDSVPLISLGVDGIELIQ